MREAQLGCRESNRCVQIRDDTRLCEGNHSISFFIANFPRQPFREFMLDDSGDEPLIAFGQLGSQPGTDW